MSGIQCFVFVVLTFLWTLTRADTDVSCIFMKSCILPCSFQSSTDVVIHWILTAGDLPVHAYYNDQDQLGYQNQRFRGRTSLFKDQISRGNASLQLTGVEVQDQSRYKCYTGTRTSNKESFLNLKVDAPVRKIHIEQVVNRITCSSEEIYPKPELTWSTNPPSNMTLKTTTTVQQTEQLLYNISSSLMLSDDVTDVVYSCTIRTRSNKRRVTLFKQTSIIGSDTETTIPCTDSHSSFLGLTWRFSHSQIILTQTGVEEEWRPHVKSVSESGSLTLQDLSSNQEGIYTCELSNAEETYIRSSFLSLPRKTNGNPLRVEGIIGVVVAVILAVVVAVVAAGLIRYNIGPCTGQQETNHDEDTQVRLNQLQHVTAQPETEQDSGLTRVI